VRAGKLSHSRNNDYLKNSKKNNKTTTNNKD
jgi:hypothetical protein